MAGPLWYHYMVSPWVIIKHTLLQALRATRANRPTTVGLLTRIAWTAWTPWTRWTQGSGLIPD